MKKFDIFLIQCNPILLLVGYVLMHSVLSLMGQNTRVASVIFDGVLLFMSIYIIAVCSKDFIIEKGKSLLTVLSVLLILYALRMVFDVYAGPFSMEIPHSSMWNDILLTVGGSFFPTWAMISSRKYIKLDAVVKGVFIAGLIACVFAFLNIRINGFSYEEGRLTLGGGLHTLALARLGAIEVIAALHMFLNGGKKRICYVAGILIGGFIALASGSRGGVAGVVVAIGIYMVVGARKRPLLMALGAILVFLFMLDVVQILEWVGNYFPVFSDRMLDSIVESDQGGRELLRQKAVNLIYENPIIGYGYRLSSDSTGYGPHHGILEVLLCLGIPVGALFCYFVYLKGAIYSVAMMSDKRYVFPCLMAVFSFVTSMSSSSLSTNSFDFSMALLGVAYYYNYKMIKRT